VAEALRAGQEAIQPRPDERREFWRFVAAVLRLRRAGTIASALEVLLRVPPNTHHLIHWGRTLREDHAREGPSAP